MDSSIIIGHDVDSLNDQIAAANNSGSKNRNKKNAGNVSTTGSADSFLDREVLHLKDFVVALGM
jgi:hypothetical protein